MGSVALHELYFGNLGGEGNKIPDPVAATLEQHFGSVRAWRREFVRAAQSLAHGSGWVALTYSRRAKRFWNQVASDHSQAAVDAAPVLVLDMYEHAYHLDFGANATAYIDAFMRNIDWAAVGARMAAVQGERAASAGRSLRWKPAVPVRRRARRPAGDGRARPGAGCAAPPPYLAHRGSHGRRGLARSRPRRDVGRGAVTGPAGRGLLRLRVSCGLQHHADAPGPWARRPVRPRRPLGLVCRRRRARDAAPGARRMTARAAGGRSMRILSRRQVLELLSLRDCIAAVEQRVSPPRRRAARSAPGVLGIPAARGGFHVKAAGPSAGAATSRPRSTRTSRTTRASGLPTIHGIVVLWMRWTAAAGAHGFGETTAADRRCDRRGREVPGASDRDAATLVGCGGQGASSWPRSRRCCRWSACGCSTRTRARGEPWPRGSQADLGIRVAAAERCSAPRESDVCVTCTPSARPSCLGPTSPGDLRRRRRRGQPDKQELEPALVASRRSWWTCSNSARRSASSSTRSPPG